MTSSPDLVLVDGSSYVYRAFHALPALNTSRGLPTNAIAQGAFYEPLIATSAGAPTLSVPRSSNEGNITPTRNRSRLFRHARPSVVQRGRSDRAITPAAFAGLDRLWFLIRCVDPPTGPLPARHEMLLAFSCKRRGFCPSSIGKSNGLFHRPHRPRRATLLAVPEQEARHRAA